MIGSRDILSSNQQWWDDGDDDGDDGTQGVSPPDNPRDLRNQLKAALKRNKELETQLVSVKGDARKANISNYFRDKGINPKLAKYVPADLDPTDDALNKWVEEDGELFNIRPAEQNGDENKPPEGGEGTPGTPGDSGGNVAPEVQAAWNSINGATSNALPPGKHEDLEAAINGAADYESLRKLLFSHGAGSI
jgi:hypothetical protein